MEQKVLELRNRRLSFLNRVFHQDEDVNSLSSYSSSSSSSSDSEDSDGVKSPSAKGRAGWRIRYNLKKEHPIFDEFCANPPRENVAVSYGSKSNRSIMYIRNFFNNEEIEQIHEIGRHPSVREIKDRKDYLNFKHEAFRVEVQMRIQALDLYEKINSASRWADKELWGKLPQYKKVYPEIEYIVYDTKLHPKGAFIEPHVDNYSVVTMIVLLTDNSEFEGGVNCFAKGKSTDEKHRALALTKGDAVFFRGERLSHWITPVKSGRRCILQMELSRV